MNKYPNNAGLSASIDKVQKQNLVSLTHYSSTSHRRTSAGKIPLDEQTQFLNFSHRCLGRPCKIMMLVLKSDMYFPNHPRNSWGKLPEYMDPRPH